MVGNNWFKTDEDADKIVMECDIFVHAVHYKCKHCGLEQSKTRFCSGCHRRLEYDE